MESTNEPQDKIIKVEATDKTTGMSQSQIKIELSSASESEMRANNGDAKESTVLTRNQQRRAEKRFKRGRNRPKTKRKEENWYDEECLAQIKLTTQMFRRFSKLSESDKVNMMSEFSTHRVEIFQKYFSVINAIEVSTTASINNAAENGGVAD